MDFAKISNKKKKKNHCKFKTPWYRYRAFSLLQPSEIASLSNSRHQNRRDRPNQSMITLKCGSVSNQIDVIDSLPHVYVFLLTISPYRCWVLNFKFVIESCAFMVLVDLVFKQLKSRLRPNVSIHDNLQQLNFTCRNVCTLNSTFSINIQLISHLFPNFQSCTTDNSTIALAI